MPPTPNRPHGQPPAQPIELWLIEDNELYRDSITSVIEEAPDLRCSLSVGSCEQALGALEQGAPPDIVLMDIGLPGISGIEGTRRIRALAPSSRVIMLTVHEESESIYQAICAGASGYLLKPSGAEAILDAIRQVAQGAAPINGYIARKLLDMFSQLAHPEGGQPDYRLTSREREVLRLLVDGLILKQIAARLDVSYHTVDTHVRNIYDKLHVNSRGGAVAKAIKERLVSLSERTGSSQAGPGRGVRRTGGGA